MADFGRCPHVYGDRRCVLWPDHKGDCAVFPPRKSERAAGGGNEQGQSDG